MRYLDLDIRSPLRHLSSGQFISNRCWTHANRKLNSHVLLVMQEGTLYIEQGGVQYEMNPGQVMILFAGESHGGFRECEGRLSYLWCHFQSRGHGEKLLSEKEASARLKHIQDGVYRFNYSDRVLCPEQFQSQDVSRLVIQMRQLMHIANSDTYIRYAADYCITSAMIELACQYVDAYQRDKTARTPAGHGQVKRFLDVLEWIRVHRIEPMTASSIAEKFGYNADYLSSLFKQNTGLSLIKYIHDIKIAQAREKLVNTDMSIRQIAYALGFQDEKYFIKLFKNNEGMTPGSYRAAYFRTHTNKE